MYGGAAHDSFIWKHSEERAMLEDSWNKNKQNNAWLLGTIHHLTIVFHSNV